MSRMHTIERTQTVARPLSEVFQFFSEASNLERMTPSFLRFRILTPLPISMAQGTLIDYRIRLCGVPQRWKTLIEVWEPPRRFVDVQLRGPYAHWRHLHEFEEVPGGTRLTDHVSYRLPFGPLGTVVHAVAVRHLLRRIFDHRRTVVEAVFASTSR